MGKQRARSALYRLTEAGQLVRQAVLVPLLERGLEPGDDTIVFVLHDQLGATEAELAARTGLSEEALGQRLGRLLERGIIAHQAIGPALAPGLALTASGDELHELLAGTWDELERALFGDLPKKQRRLLKQSLNRFVDLLQLSQ
jgi:DNA-binding MarR family transcriptional regulator